MALNRLFPVSNRDNKVIVSSHEPNYTFEAGNAATLAIIEQYLLRRHDQPGTYFELEYALASGAALTEVVSVALVYSTTELSSTNTGTVLASQTLTTGSGRSAVKGVFSLRIRPLDASPQTNGVVGTALVTLANNGTLGGDIAATWSANERIYIGLRLARTTAAPISFRYVKTEAIFGIPRVLPAAYAA